MADEVKYPPGAITDLSTLKEGETVYINVPPGYRGYLTGGARIVSFPNIVQTKARRAGYGHWRLGVSLTPQGYYDSNGYTPEVRGFVFRSPFLCWAWSLKAALPEQSKELA